MLSMVASARPDPPPIVSCWIAVLLTTLVSTGSKSPDDKQVSLRTINKHGRGDHRECHLGQDFDYVAMACDWPRPQPPARNAPSIPAPSTCATATRISVTRISVIRIAVHVFPFFSSPPPLLLLSSPLISSPLPLSHSLRPSSSFGHNNSTQTLPRITYDIGLFERP